jgi:hypothetical protein
MKLISALGVCTIIAYIILALFVAIEILQSRLASSHKCSRRTHIVSLLEKSESVKEISLMPKVMEVPPRNEIACFVMTTVERRNARSVIRRSWGKVLKPLFVMVLSDNATTMDFVVNEAKVFDDLIVISGGGGGDDDLRTSVAFQTFVKYFKYSKYFMKANDDVLVNPQNLYDFLNDEKTPMDAIIGSVMRFPNHGRINELVMSYMQTRYDIEHVEDSTYLIPGFMVENIFGFSTEISFSMPEIAFVTGLAPRMLNYKIFDGGKMISKRPIVVHPCLIE